MSLRPRVKDNGDEEAVGMRLVERFTIIGCFWKNSHIGSLAEISLTDFPMNHRAW